VPVGLWVLFPDQGIARRLVEGSKIVRPQGPELDEVTSQGGLKLEVQIRQASSIRVRLADRVNETASAIANRLILGH
jgi:hypothetical protein